MENKIYRHDNSVSHGKFSELVSM